MPIYMIVDTANNQTPSTRLVEAPNPAQALRHIVQSQFVVNAANATQVAKMMQAGVQLESAVAASDDATDQPEPKTATAQPEGY